MAYENSGGRFRKTTLRGISGKKWTSAAWADLNADGRPDVALAGPKKIVILKNTGKHFRKVWSHDLVHGRIGVWTDVNNNGRLDLFVVQSARIQNGKVAGPNKPDFLVVNRPRRFVQVTNDVLAGPSQGAGDSVTAFDYDNDGRTDLLVTNGFKESGPVELLRNESAAGSWVDLRLAYSMWNPWGFGSTVTVRAGGRTYRHQVTDGMNLASQAPPGRLHFGIGNAVDARVVVRWPDGSRDCRELTVNAETVLTPTGGTCPS